MQITAAFVNEVAIFKDTLIQPICLIAQGDSYVIAHSWIFFFSCLPLKYFIPSFPSGRIHLAISTGLGSAD